MTWSHSRSWLLFIVTRSGSSPFCHSFFFFFLLTRTLLYTAWPVLHKAWWFPLFVTYHAKFETNRLLSRKNPNPDPSASVTTASKMTWSHSRSWLLFIVTRSGSSSFCHSSFSHWQEHCLVQLGLFCIRGNNFHFSWHTRHTIAVQNPQHGSNDLYVLKIVSKTYDFWKSQFGRWKWCMLSSNESHHSTRRLIFETHVAEWADIFFSSRLMTFLWDFPKKIAVYGWVR
jgi:hypothetical protein